MLTRPVEFTSMKELKLQFVLWLLISDHYSGCMCFIFQSIFCGRFPIIIFFFALFFLVIGANWCGFAKLLICIKRLVFFRGLSSFLKQQIVTLGLVLLIRLYQPFIICLCSFWWCIQDQELYLSYHLFSCFVTSKGKEHVPCLRQLSSFFCFVVTSNTCMFSEF